MVRGIKRWLGAAALVVTGFLVAPAAAQTVLFDQGHGQRFVADRDGELDLSGLAGVFRAGGFSVRTSGGPVTGDGLAGVDVLVVSGPFAPYTAAERRAVAGFLGRGGRLVVLLHIPHPVLDLLDDLGVGVWNGVVNERDGVLGGRPTDFRVSDLSDHPVNRGLDGFSLYGGWALEPRDGVEVLARTSPFAWVDKDRDRAYTAGERNGSFAVAVAGRRGRGRFVVFGDDAIFQNRFLAGENRRLAENLVSWVGATEL